MDFANSQWAIEPQSTDRNATEHIGPASWNNSRSPGLSHSVETVKPTAMGASSELRDNDPDRGITSVAFIGLPDLHRVVFEVRTRLSRTKLTDTVWQTRRRARNGG